MDSIGTAAVETEVVGAVVLVDVTQGLEVLTGQKCFRLLVINAASLARYHLDQPRVSQSIVVIATEKTVIPEDQKAEIRGEITEEIISKKNRCIRPNVMNVVITAKCHSAQPKANQFIAKIVLGIKSMPIEAMKDRNKLHADQIIMHSSMRLMQS